MNLSLYLISTCSYIKLNKYLYTYPGYGLGYLVLLWWLWILDYEHVIRMNSGVIFLRVRTVMELVRCTIQGCSE
jgi:hypothetical protein